jgi:hypothetical protein
LKLRVMERGVKRPALWGLTVGAVVLVLLGVAAAPAPAGAAATAYCDASAYRLALRALTGPKGAGAQLVIRIAASTPDCELPETLDDVRATIGSRTVDVQQVAAPGATATVPLGRVLRRQIVAAAISFGPQLVLQGRARTLLEPDLVVRKVSAPRARLAGRPFWVVATVAEPNRDVGATATVTVSAAGTAVGTGSVKIGPGRRAAIKVATTLTAPGPNRLDVTVAADLPETSTANNRRRATVEVTEFQVQAANVVVPTIAGYGGQFNHHVYAQISRDAGVTDANVVDMEQKMKALHPEFSRIFFTLRAFDDPDRMQSFVRTVELAQTAGATINITWQGGTLDVKGGNIQRFANVLIDLVKNRGISNLRWVTLQNEPNSTRLTPAQVEQEYRELDPYIQSIRGQVKYMGGDLVRGPGTGDNQRLWFDYMAQHMADILDAWSIHVFWDYWDTQKIVDRLTEVRAIWDAEPESQRKPLYVAEYGVRGLRVFNGVRADPGFWEDGTPISQTNVSAFQHAWFDVLSSKLGYLGTSKWDSYFGRYDNATQAYYMIGDPQSGWPLYPLYHFVRLMTATVRPGWSVVDVESVPDTSRLVTAYFGKTGQRTLVGLDTAGAQLNTVSTTAVSYVIGGLPPSTRLHLAVWNEAGDGQVARSSVIVTDAAGVVTISVPQHGVFALTTLRLA